MNSDIRLSTDFFDHHKTLHMLLVADADAVLAMLRLWCVAARQRPTGDVAGIPDPFVAVLGDSTFFHSGIPPLLDIVHNGGKSTVMILDNYTTAMTGHQDHPGVAEKLGGQQVPKVEIEAVVRACGVDHVQVVDAFDVKVVRKALEEALEYDGPSVIIADGPCYFVGPGAAGIYDVDLDACVACGTCARLGCPAVIRTQEVFPKTGKRKAAIDPVLCVGCDMCAQVCPKQAIFAVEAAE